MGRYTVTKLLWHLGISALIWLLIDRLSPAGRLYAGWFAGFLGACYLLAGWLSLLRSRGTDLTALLRRKRPPDVPYYLRGVDKDRKPRLSLNGNRHFFDDDGADSAEEQQAAVPKSARQKRDAWIFCAVGVCLLLLSAL